MESNKSNVSDQSVRLVENSPETGYTPLYSEALNRLLSHLQPIDFVGMLPGIIKSNIRQKHQLVLGVDHILQISRQHSLGLRYKDGQFYIFNGSYFQQTEESVIQSFLGYAFEKMGIEHIEAHFFQ